MMVERKTVKTIDPIKKDVKKIPLPSINPNQFDLDSQHELFKPDCDSIYIPIKYEDTQQNNS